MIDVCLTIVFVMLFIVVASTVLLVISGKLWFVWIIIASALCCLFAVIIGLIIQDRNMIYPVSLSIFSFYVYCVVRGNKKRKVTK